MFSRFKGSKTIKVSLSREAGDDKIHYRVVDGGGDEVFAVEVTENLLREAGVSLNAVEPPWRVELRVSESVAKKVAEEALRSGMLAGAARMRAGTALGRN